MLIFYAGCRYRALTSLNCRDECALLQYSNGENGEIMIRSNPRHNPNTCPARGTRNKLSTLFIPVSLLYGYDLILALVDLLLVHF